MDAKQRLDKLVQIRTEILDTQGMMTVGLLCDNKIVSAKIAYASQLLTEASLMIKHSWEIIAMEMEDTNDNQETDG